MDEIMVSVCCTAYNHEKYIRKCLDGFLMQKTNFKFEVIVHDDASTDGTAAIIHEYELKYPDVIKPIYQTENQFSKGTHISFTYLYPNAKGKYIALCEGDDFWTDANKLQKQFDALEANPECNMCVSKAKVISEDESVAYGFYPKCDVEEGVIDSRRFLEIVLTQVSFQTSTYFFKAEGIRAFMNPVPEFREISPVGDRPKLMFFGQLGPVYYLPSEVSCYRWCSSGSWSDSIYGEKDRMKKHRLRMIETYKSFDEYTCHKYHDLCALRVFSEYYNCAYSKNEFKSLIKDECFDCQPLRTKTKVYVGAYFPSILKAYYKITGKSDV